MNQCRNDGCERPIGVHKHGLCRACYEAERRRGNLGVQHVCSVDGCAQRVAARGLCDLHYGRLKRTGSAEGRTVLSRLQERTEVDPGGCWNWTGSTREGGYGGMRVGGVSRQVHRLGYEALVGPIPEGLQIDHLCRNKLCWNPEHLEAVTQRENILRSENMAARWARRTECHVCGGELTQYPKRRVCLACQRRKHHERKNR